MIDDTPSRFCELVNFYASEKVAREGMNDSDAAILSMADAFRLAELLTVPLRNAGL